MCCIYLRRFVVFFFIRNQDVSSFFLKKEDQLKFLISVLL